LNPVGLVEIVVFVRIARLKITGEHSSSFEEFKYELGTDNARLS
jgi:hypothetical protein